MENEPFPRYEALMDDETLGAFTDPAMVMVSLGALVGLLAAAYWLKVFRAVEPAETIAAGKARSDLSSAALLTAACLTLTCGGFLFGRLTGRF